MDSINWLAIAIAVVVSMVIGAVWYSPPVFAKQWMGYIGKTEEELKAGGPALGYLVAVLCAFLAALVLAYVTRWANADNFVDGMMLGATLWLGFTLTSILMNGIFEQRAYGLIMINAGNMLLTTMVQAGIIAQMG